jgi:hypothetical protein
MYFRTILEGGIGSEFALGGTIDVGIRIRRERWPVALYVGVGTSATVISGSTKSRPDVSYHVGGGPAVVTGLRHRSGLFSEIQVGLSGVDYVRAKWTVGYRLK